MRITIFLAVVAHIFSNILGANGCCECKYEIEELKDLLLKVVENTKPAAAPSSCAEILRRDPGTKSGEYTIVDAKGQSQKVFCQMESPGSGCGDGGWQRVAYFARSSTGCPSGFIDYQSKGCSNTGTNCNKVEFQADQEYTKVCGKVQGYGISSNDAFHRLTTAGNANDINSAYLDGISVTYGSPLKHLWSYAASGFTHNSPVTCPCINAGGRLPPFVNKDHYYCEGGARGGLNNVLWDGKQCHQREQGSCCNKPNQPWFLRTISKTRDPIQLRVCTDQALNDERVVVSQYEIYVQ